MDKILKIIQRKVLKGTHLPVTVKEMQAGYLIIPYFKDLYILHRINCLTLNQVLESENISRKIYTIGFIIVQISNNTRKETTLLAISEICADNIITLYQSSLFVGHQDIVNCRE